MATVLKGGTVVDLEPASVEVADLRIEGDQIVDRATALEPKPDDEVIDVRGKVLFPGLVSAHHHFYATLLRGAPRAGIGFGAETAALNRLEDVIDGDQLEAAATAGGLEGLLSGTTTVFDVTAAHAIGAQCLGVATGGFSVVQLMAAGADWAYETLADPGAMDRLLQG